MSSQPSAKPRWLKVAEFALLGLCAVVLILTIPEAVHPWRGFRAFYLQAGLALCIAVGALGTVLRPRSTLTTWVLIGLSAVMLACWILLQRASQA